MSHSMLDIVNITEKAALASYLHVGTLDKELIDAAATNVMREELNELEHGYRVAIGEGEMDEAPMLYIGEKLGKSSEVEFDLAVDPIDGTTPASKGQDNALSVIAVAEKDGFLHAPDMYMKKSVVASKFRGLFSLNDDFDEILERMIIKKAELNDTSPVTVVIQDRERHQDYIKSVKQKDGRVILFNDGDILNGLKPLIQSDEVDLFFNIGGAPEGVVLASAVKCLDGEMQAQLYPIDESEHRRCGKMGISDIDKIYFADDLVKSDFIFFVGTAVTKTEIIKEIQKVKNQYVTHSIIIDNINKSFRLIENYHNSIPSLT
ncbi:class II fructose-bisphosphatase [Staphylococcus simulans]|uniref:class II fructose-bisphosphatase n=1 Tax=Staphylococcus simulans TaxID=1286 RepID=UPI0013049041|nr:class II fructose-bisphosphatase [Staphylococcus simulans]MDY5060370.1 class II fructose-bisphosphatase [Staphylococcus simulans]